MTCTARRPPHRNLILVLEIICWAILLAAWIAICVDIVNHTECIVGPHDRTCDTIYAALAFVFFNWIVFTVTMFLVGRHVLGPHEDK